MSQIFDRVYLCKSLNKDEYLEKHKEIASSVLSTEEIPFKQLSNKDYLDAHKIVVESIIETNGSAKDKINYFSEHEKTIRDISSKGILKYPIDAYLNAHREIVENIEKHFNNLSLFFNPSDDKYLCVIGKMEDVVEKEIPLYDYKLLFKPLNKKEYFEYHKDLVFKVKDAIGTESKNISLESINNDRSLIREIISRVEKRKVYFHLFHKGLEMGQLNEIALYCFWILKFQPFKYGRYPVTPGKKWDTDKVNVLVAIHLFLSAVKFFIRDRYAKGEIKSDSFKPSEQFLRNLGYSFKVHDLSKEAIMVLAESLVI